MNVSSNWELEALTAYARTGAHIYWDHLVHVGAQWREGRLPPRRGERPIVDKHTQSLPSSRSVVGTRATTPAAAPVTTSPTPLASSRDVTRMERAGSSGTVNSASSAVNDGATPRQLVTAPPNAPADLTPAPPGVPRRVNVGTGDLDAATSSRRVTAAATDVTDRAPPPPPLTARPVPPTRATVASVPVPHVGVGEITATAQRSRAVSDATDASIFAVAPPVMHVDKATVGVQQPVARLQLPPVMGETDGAAPGATVTPATTLREEDAVSSTSRVARPMPAPAIAEEDAVLPTPSVAGAGQGMLSEMLRDAPGREREGMMRRGGGSATATPARESGTGAAGGDAASGGASGVISVKIYLPSKASVKLRLPDSASVSDVIAEVLRYTRAAGVTPALAGDSKCYELRLHDEDGEPDDDFPALDKTRKIRNFGHGGAHEYVLKAIASAMAAFLAAAGPAAAAAGTVPGAAAGARTSVVLTPARGPVTPETRSRPSAVGVEELMLTSPAMVAAAAPASTATPVPPVTPSARRRDTGDTRTPSTAAGAPEPLAGGSAVTSPSSSVSEGLGGALTQPPPSLRVIMQSAGHATPSVTMVPFRDDLRVQDVIEYVAKRHRLPVFHEKYVLKVTAVDQVRLNMASRELPSTAMVAQLALDTVEIIKKTYADTPPERTSGTAASGLGRGRHGSDVMVGRPTRMSAITSEASGRGESVRSPGGSSASGSATTYGMGGTMAGTMMGGGGTAAGGGTLIAGSATSIGLARPLVQPGMGPGGLMHNAITAAQFQEWYVIKVNKRGRRQERLMGIDLTRITNRKVEKKRFVSDRTVNAERLISDIRRVEIPEGHRTLFTITFREGDSEDVALAYETRSAFEREEITAKLAYIMRMNGDQHKIVRVP